MMAAASGLLSVAVAIATIAAWSSLAEGRSASAPAAMFVFGDSSADVGNNNFLGRGTPKVDHYPYGVDLPDLVPTGRFSNGYNEADFLAKMMGFKMSPPPALSLTSNSTIFEFRGANFASGGSGIFDDTGKNTSISMNEQIQIFGKVVDTMTRYSGSSKVQNLLANSIFLFSIGSNDLFRFITAFGNAANSTQKDQFITFLCTNFKWQLQILYMIGARKFAIVGTIPLGCVPSSRRTNHPSGQCMEDLNDMSRRYNTALKGVVLQELSLELCAMSYSFSDSYKVISGVLKEPARFGFKEIESACCGDGKFRATSPCNANASLCSNRREYLFWDRDGHPTQATYELMARRAFKGSHAYTTPVNIRHLLKHGGRSII